LRRGLLSRELPPIYEGRKRMMMLRFALTFLVLSAISLLLVPLALAKILGLIFAFLFVVFLLLGLATVDNLAV
jgi:uncharacterized membrane protein YtjA (UPF0391 family)